MTVAMLLWCAWWYCDFSDHAILCLVTSLLWLLCCNMSSGIVTVVIYPWCVWWYHHCNDHAVVCLMTFLLLWCLVALCLWMYYMLCFLQSFSRCGDGPAGPSSVCFNPSGPTEYMCILFSSVGCLISSMFFVIVQGLLECQTLRNRIAVWWRGRLLAMDASSYRPLACASCAFTLSTALTLPGVAHWLSTIHALP